jgi:hypothetical protein
MPLHKGRKTSSKSSNQTGSTLIRQHVRHGSVTTTPLFRGVLGGAMLLVMAIVSCFSVLTTQNLIKGGHGEGVVLNWGVFLQAFDLMAGKYTGIDMVAIIASWALFVLYLIFGAMEVITPDGQEVDKLFRTAILLLLFFDGVATYTYLSILPFWYQCLFTILVPVCIGFFGKFGLTLILGAIADILEAQKS